MASDIPSISEWLQGRNVFITGGSGFMGKVLIYKLLVSCDHLENIFVLIRKKKDVDPQTRLQCMIKEQIRSKENHIPFKSFLAFPEI